MKEPKLRPGSKRKEKNEWKKENKLETKKKSTFLSGIVVVKEESEQSHEFAESYNLVFEKGVVCYFFKLWKSNIVYWWFMLLYSFSQKN